LGKKEGKGPDEGGDRAARRRRAELDRRERKWAMTERGGPTAREGRRRMGLD